MNKHHVTLIGIVEFDNLGLCYLASMLSEKGFSAQIIDFRKDKKSILEEIIKSDPIVVGFSVVYENYIDEFSFLANYLRKAGVGCHFTAGGHYASLRTDELFEFIPSLDSVVRFEGEYTFVELVDNISSGKGITNIKGLAYKKNSKIITTPLRPLEINIDKFPFPERSLTLKEYVLGKKFSTILAGRGCIYDCSYCSTHEFFKKASGPIKRIRNPEMVAEEMEYLYCNHNCSVFLFMDDDFPVKTNQGSEWIEKFCHCLDKKGLKNKVIWKINCRPDEIEYNLFSLMKSYGLFLVFLGLEDGTDSGLRRLNKHMTVENSIRGINILKKIGVGFDFGFMLFQPSTTFSSLIENLKFLRLICGDGYTPVNFLKVLPYYETRIEKELKASGRLKGNPGMLDYDFQEKSINEFYKFINNSFFYWLRAPDGMVNISRWARNYLLVISHFYEEIPEFHQLSHYVKHLTETSNLFLLNKMMEIITIFKSAEHNELTYQEVLNKHSENIKERHSYFTINMHECISELLYIFEPSNWV